ncbi:nuclease-related domain-containing protein [Bacillus sp. JJ1532]|uniref:nuclease-related domain-containing protein n=1 Tax=Bacillus sp. JJ1532 TaxID=3122958 RepID=UPI002FFDE916
MEPVELKFSRYLNAREGLTDSEKIHYLSLEKGFQGEKMFDSLSASLSNNWLIINDLMLKYNNTVFQIDTLLISSAKIYLLDIKNYEGDYYIKDDRWYKVPKKEIRNLIHQLQRSETLLRSLLQEIGINIPIESFLIFVNPEFYLYEATLDLPIIFPPQLKGFLKHLNNQPEGYYEKQIKLAKQLVSMHVQVSPYMRIPEYSYDQLKKGLFCLGCQSFNIYNLSRNTLICNECGYKENSTNAVLRGIEEFSFLFPDKKVTTNVIYEWCQVIHSKKTIHRVLSQNFIQVGKRKHSYYVKEE